MAKLAGVSAVTVSRALRHPGMVSPALRDRIGAAVSELAYVPDVAASRLASSRTHTIGVIVSSLTNGVFADYLRALHDTLLPAGFQVVVFSSRYSAEEEEKVVATLIGQHPEAIIIAGIDQTPHARRLLERPLQALGVPVQRHDQHHREMTAEDRHARILDIGTVPVEDLGHGGDDAGTVEPDGGDGNMHGPVTLGRGPWTSQRARTAGRVRPGWETSERLSYGIGTPSQVPKNKTNAHPAA